LVKFNGNVVEDVKALNQNCIVSNIAVHKEQLAYQGYFFDPNNADSLIAQIMKIKTIHSKSFDFDYQKKIQDNARALKKFFSKKVLKKGAENEVFLLLLSYI